MVERSGAKTKLRVKISRNLILDSAIFSEVQVDNYLVTFPTRVKLEKLRVSFVK